ncbi:MAG: flagellar protein FlaG [Desulfobacteraceae bacterium]
MNINYINTAQGGESSAVESSKPVSQQQLKTETPEKAQNLSNSERIQNDRKEKQQKEEGLTSEETNELTEELNDYMDDLQTKLGFSIHDKLNHQVVVEIKNRETDEIIKQIPAEELLDIKEKMLEFRGMLLDHSI